MISMSAFGLIALMIVIGIASYFMVNSNIVSTDGPDDKATYQEAIEGAHEAVELLEK